MPINVGPAPAATLANGTRTVVSNVAVRVAVANAAARVVIIQNTGSDAVFIGAAGVSATTGFKLAAGVIAAFDSPPILGGDLYAIRETTDSAVVVSVAT